MIAQDTGSAIKGTTRGDIFFGHGDNAQEKAFYMASKENIIFASSNILDRFN